MFDFVRAVKFGVVAAAVTLMLLAAPSQSQAASGRVHARLFKAGFIVGAGGGNGTLTFHGRRYPLTFSGVSFGTIGLRACRWWALPRTCTAQRTLPAVIPRLVPDSPLSAVQKWQGYRTRGGSSCDYAGCRLVLTYPSISRV